MNRQVLLLSVVGGLLLSRFVLVPLNATRVEKSDEYQAKVERFLKGERLINQRDKLDKDLAEVEIKLQKYESLIPNSPSSFEAQLKIQQQIQTLAKNSSVLLDELEWVSTQVGYPETAILELSFSGNLKKVMNFSLSLNKIGVWLSIKSMDYRVNKQNVGWKQLGEAKGKIVIEVFYINKEKV